MVNVAAGVCDAAVASREVLGVRLYWSELADIESCLGTPEALKQAALQFHQVLREILATTTPIPFRFPTLLDSSDNLEQHLAAEQELYCKALARVEGAVQYEIVASWADEQEADLAAPVSGREYLKRRQEAAGRVSAVEGKLKSVTADSVREWRSRQERKTHRWFALVPRECRERFLASLRTAGGPTPGPVVGPGSSTPTGPTPGPVVGPGSPGVRLRLSGPWPPSEFITARGERG